MNKWIMAGTAAAFTGAAAFARSEYERTHLDIVHYDIKTDKLGLEWNGFKAVFLSDLHDNSFGMENEELLAAIEKEMKKIVKQSLPLEVFEVKKEEALSYMKERQEDYKVEMIEELPEDETITFYKQGDYEEFCAGPHESKTCVIKAIKLLSTAGEYLRCDEKNKMLTRIYVISFPKASELKDYLNMLEEAKKREHRKLAKELGLFTIMEECPRFPFFLTK